MPCSQPPGKTRRVRRLPVSYREEALQDLAEVFWFVLAVSQHIEIAEGFVRRIKSRCERIGDAPQGGRLRDDLYPGLRTVPFERSAVIAYLVEPDCVRVTNVFYGGRDYEAIMREEGL